MFILFFSYLERLMWLLSLGLLCRMGKIELLVYLEMLFVYGRRIQKWGRRVTFELYMRIYYLGDPGVI